MERLGKDSGDYFTIKRFDFDIKKIQSKLEKSHCVLSKIFKASITDYALNEWK